jgi:hypothetical protein
MSSGRLAVLIVDALMQEGYIAGRSMNAPCDAVRKIIEERIETKEIRFFESENERELNRLGQKLSLGDNF